MRQRAAAAVVIVLACAAAVWVVWPTDDAPVAVPEPVVTTTVPPPTTAAPRATKPPEPWLVEVAVATPALVQVWRERPPDPTDAPATTTTTVPGGAPEATAATVTTLDVASALDRAAEDGAVVSVGGAPTVPSRTSQPATAPGVQTVDDLARRAAFDLLTQDAHALEAVGIDDDPPPARAVSGRRVGLAPTAEPLIALGSMERTSDRGPLTGPAPALPRERSLTSIPSPGLRWGGDATEDGWTFTNPTPSGNARVFLVTDRVGDWVQVMLPTRPNQQVGWVRRSDVVLARHRWHIEIDVSENLLRVWEGDRLEIETLVVDGRASTPTPLGRFYLNERVAQAPGTFYAPWIFSTNGFSDTLERFSGEVPIFALHGGGYANTIGTDISNGCIRIPPEIVARMGELLPMGTPVDIHP